MKYEGIFVDTNFLVYAHDPREKRKHQLAKEQIEKWWLSSTVPILSIQVLQEFYVTLTRLGLAKKTAKELTEVYSSWRVIDNDKNILYDALEISERSKVSFWDSLILAAAIKAGAEELWTEDLSHGQKFGPVKVRNPFKGQ